MQESNKGVDPASGMAFNEKLAHKELFYKVIIQHEVAPPYWSSKAVQNIQRIWIFT